MMTVDCEACTYPVDRLDSDSETEDIIKCPVCHHEQPAPEGFYDQT